jgi:type IV pilus assembly protein PilE
MHRKKGSAGAHRRGGVTLIELLLAMAVLAILLALAWPSYGELVRKSRRLDAVTGLYRVQLAQERHHAAHYRYAENLTELGWGADEADSAERHYRLRLAPVADARLGYRALAEPRPGSDQARDACGVFAFTQDGRDPAWPADPSCWPR